ncbi:MAG: YbhB/YbcL family Raf kinase inhibitor-like protein [Acidimicrobiales bacterium]
MVAERRPPLPYDFLPTVPPLTVTSDDIADGQPLANAHVANEMGLTGENLSPHIRWADAPAGTQSFTVTCFDPDAPTGSGFWHWVLFDIPASVNELARGAGSGSMEGLPKGALHARNDAGAPGYVGAFPPPGHGDHRYVFAVSALSVPTLGLDATASPPFVGFNVTSNTVARGLIVPLFGR